MSIIFRIYLRHTSGRYRHRLASILPSKTNDTSLPDNTPPRHQASGTVDRAAITYGLYAQRGSHTHSPFAHFLHALLAASRQPFSLKCSSHYFSCRVNAQVNRLFYYISFPSGAA
jgi:hypothetical protein